MAFSEFETAANQKALSWFMDEVRPPVHIRPELDIGYTVIGQTVDIFEIRPDWQDKSTIRHHPVSRIKFVRTEGRWRLYWMRGNLKWNTYDPDLEHRTLQSALGVVKADALGCFFG